MNGNRLILFLFNMSHVIESSVNKQTKVSSSIGLTVKGNNNLVYQTVVEN